MGYSYKGHFESCEPTVFPTVLVYKPIEVEEEEPEDLKKKGKKGEEVKEEGVNYAAYEEGGIDLAFDF